MSENPLKSDNTAVESSGDDNFVQLVTEEFTVLTAHTVLATIAEFCRDEDVRANWGAFQQTFLELVFQPKHLAPLVVDYWLLVQSIWSRRQPGPDLVYPMLSIRKRHSGRLASLVLERSRNEQSYELRTTTRLSQGINPPCVAVIDLDEVPHETVENGYSTPVNLHGQMCMLVVINSMIVLAVQVFCQYGWGWATSWNWLEWASVNLLLCLHAVFRGDGTLVLARRSDTTAPGYAVLLDQDFTVILNGSQSVVEAIAESSFNLSHPNALIEPSLEGDHNCGQHSPYRVMEALCEGVYLAVSVLCLLLFAPPAIIGSRVAIQIAVYFVAALLELPPDNFFVSLQETLDFMKRYSSRFLPSLVFLWTYESAKIEGSILGFDWSKHTYFLPIFLFLLFLDRYRDQNYPIRSEKLFDALGRPRVRKWQFDTLAAAATFQSLVLCRGITRPIRRIDVLAFLDMLVPDERDVWKAWKARVADRIRYEKDIDFTPTIPMFGDERQRQLKHLLDQAQFGNDTYRHFYG